MSKRVGQGKDEGTCENGGRAGKSRSEAGSSFSP